MLGRRVSRFLVIVAILMLPFVNAFHYGWAQTAKPLNFAFVNGQWFNGRSFERRTAYSVDGRLTFKEPAQVDRTVDLSGSWVVPPFADAHNHSIGTGDEDSDRSAIRRFLADGVFYVKMQGNLPLTDDMKGRLRINRPDSVDAVFAQGSLTVDGGHPSFLMELLLQAGVFPGHTKETLKDLRYFTIDSEADLNKKWPLVLSQRPDFIKTFLWRSDEFERRKADPAAGFQKGLDPRLLAKIVERAHEGQMRVSTHIVSNADFHNALSAGVDEIAHIPQVDTEPLSVEDTILAATRGVVVDTTVLSPLVPLVKFRALREADVPAVRRAQMADLKLLAARGVRLAVGSDSADDTSVAEFLYLKNLGIFDNLTLLKMWTETAQTIAPGRKIGVLSEGYEASFLALRGNPLDDLENVRKIQFRFKQGVPLQ